MDREVSQGSSLGVTLLALAAIIGIGFGIFMIAKGIANEGVVNMTDSLLTVSQSKYQDFDQKVINGSQVMAAYKQFEDDKVVILIATRAFLQNAATLNPLILKTGGTSGTRVLADASKSPGYIAEAYVYSETATDNIGTAITVKNGAAVDPQLTFINYNAMLAGQSAVKTNPAILRKDGKYVTNWPLRLDASGSVEFNTNSQGMATSGNSEYISSSAKFQANLIVDQSGSIVGIVFQQLVR